MISSTFDFFSTSIGTSNRRPSVRTRTRSIRRHVGSTAAALFVALSTLSACTGMPARDLPPANETLPASLQAYPGEVLQDVFRVQGDETYVCRREGTRLQWQETGPQATLVDASRHNVGVVSPGGYFIADDGSYVVARVNGQEQVSASALPWQRLVSRFNSSEPGGSGRFANVTSIQRVQTVGGLPPNSTCTVERAGLYVPYSATYLFYRRATPGAARDDAGVLGTGELREP